MIFSGGSGRKTSVRFSPGCLFFSLFLSLALTVLLNVLVRLF
jgi:hypothetical protein